MIDPVRHFIGIKYIRKLIEAMPLSKLNMVHWLFSND
jgi:N-acetyl-beta-hexosaminidase